MRFVIYGAGGIGGTIGARLHLSGFDVGLIARGAHYEAIARDGLRFVSPSRDVHLRIPCFPHPDDANIRPDDAVILCMKGQDTEDALRDLYAATGGDARVVCCQNGVENERLALRRFPRTYGMVVLLPAEHLEPGVVVNFAEDTAGDSTPAAIPPASTTSSRRSPQRFDGRDSVPRRMAPSWGQKYAKLLGNLNNAVNAATGTGSRAVAAKLREEALACYRAAGIHCATVEETRARRADIRGGDVPGHDRHGGSSLQSVLRGTGDIETDFMNGEIVLLGRLHGVPVPANTVVQQIGNSLVLLNLEPGSMTVEELESRVLG